MSFISICLILFSLFGVGKSTHLMPYYGQNTYVPIQQTAEQMPSSSSSSSMHYHPGGGASFQPGTNGIADQQRFRHRNDDFGTAGLADENYSDHPKGSANGKKPNHPHMMAPTFSTADDDDQQQQHNTNDATTKERRRRGGKRRKQQKEQPQQQQGLFGRAMKALVLMLSATLFLPKVPHNLMIRTNDHYVQVEPYCVRYGRGFKCDFETDPFFVGSARSNLEIWGDVEPGSSDLLLLGKKKVDDCSWEPGNKFHCSKEIVVEPDQLDKLEHMSIDEAIQHFLWSTGRTDSTQVAGGGGDETQLGQEEDGFGGWGQPSPAAPVPYGRLKVRGNKLYGENGEQAQLNGMSLFWSQYSDKFWNEESIQKLKCDWHVNVIRAPVGVEPNGYLANPMQEMAKLQRVIEACHKFGVYFIVDWHLTSANPYTDRAVQFFSAISSRYGNMPNIIYETWNEAVYVSWDQMVNHHQQVIRAIRANDPLNLIICGTPSYDMWLGDAFARPLPFENIMYAVHWYAASNQGGPNGGDDDVLFSQAMSFYERGMPLFNTEYGVGNGATSNVPLNYGQAQKWLNWLTANKIPTINWSVYADNRVPCFPIVEGTTPETLGDDNQLTPDGRFIKGMLQRLNPAGQCPAPSQMPNPPAGQYPPQMPNPPAGQYPPQMPNPPAGQYPPQMPNPPAGQYPPQMPNPPNAQPPQMPNPPAVQNPPQPNPSATTVPYGRLKVRGNKLYGENGEQAQLNGMSLFWSQYSDKFWNEESIQKLKCDWHVNVIRAPVGVEPNGYLANPMQEMAKLQRVIEACRKYDIYFIVDWHLTSDNPYTDRAVQFFSAISSRYGNMPNIIYETWNEAVGVSWDQMVNHHQQVIRAIRANDPLNLILCGTPRYDMALYDAFARPLPFENIMYPFHWYAADGQGGANGGDDAFLAEAMSVYERGMPLFCTEYGTGSGASINVLLNYGQAQKWLSWMTANKIPSINWSVYEDNRYANVASFPLVEGTTPATLGDDNQLTADGRFIKGMLQRLNPAVQCPRF